MTAHPNGTNGTNGTKYALISDEPEALRLNKQHERLKRLFDGKLLPDEVKLREGDRVLDSGTGTGIWALDVAPTLPPSVEIDCIDITPTLFPRSPPPNLHFTTGNILALPPTSHNTYSLVHQRFLTAAFGDEDWLTCLRNIFAALRPGGWVKLEELEGRIMPESDGLPHSKKMTELAREIERKRGIDFTAVENIERWLKEVGFEDVKVNHKRWVLGPGEEHKEDREVIRGAWRAMRLGMLKSGSNFGYSDEEWERYLKDLENEYEQNEAWIPIFDFIARKPVSA